MAQVNCEVVALDDGSGGGEPNVIDVIVTDEANLGAARQCIASDSGLPLLILCGGAPGDAALELLRSGVAELARDDDAVAIASVLQRAASRSSASSMRFDRAHAHLQQLVEERTRELEEAHQRQRVSERMAAMGTLSTGIGHDIGNLVLPLRIGLESLESRKLPKGCEPDLNAIRKAVEFLQGLANGLRYLAMDPEDAGLGARHNDLAEWWSDVEPLLENCLPREVKLVRDFADDLPYVSIPLHHLTQTVFNLVQNAGDAMRRHGPGRVCVRARAVQREDSADPQIELQIIDDGPGMSQEVQQRCLDPFFTTKFRGVRTGLGLSLVHGLVHRAGGEVGLKSTPGGGTTWTLTLPAKKRSDRQPPGSRPTARVELRDHRMRAYVASVLNSLDFDVALDGESARTALCVVESGSPLATIAPSLLDDDEHLRIVLFGSAECEHPRLHQLGPGPSSAAIRAALRDVRSAL